MHGIIEPAVQYGQIILQLFLKSNGDIYSLTVTCLAVYIFLCLINLKNKNTFLTVENVCWYLFNKKMRF